MPVVGEYCVFRDIKVKAKVIKTKRLGLIG